MSLTGIEAWRRRVQATVAMLDKRDAHRRLPAVPALGCPDCSARPHEWCDPWCSRFSVAPEAARGGGEPVTREEFAALLADICGIRLNPLERATILYAAAAYAVAEAARIIARQAELDAIPEEASP